MPIYAYHCQNCGADAEYIQKFSDPPMAVCEKCNGKLERAVTAAAFHLKGGGWYKDGYASAKADGGGEAKTDAKDAKTESKPAESKPAESKPASDSGGTTSTAKAASE